MSERKTFRQSVREAGGFYNWANAKMLPYIGPPPLGPYGEEPLPPTSGASCPLCGHPMSEHEIDRTGPRTQLHCPVDAPEPSAPAPAQSPTPPDAA